MVDVNFGSSVMVSALFVASFARWPATSFQAMALCPGVHLICTGTSFIMRTSMPLLMSVVTAL